MPYRLEIYIPPSPKFISRRPPPQSRSNPATSPQQLAQTLEAKAITRMANEYDSECRLFVWMPLVCHQIRALQIKWLQFRSSGHGFGFPSNKVYQSELDNELLLKVNTDPLNFCSFFAFHELAKSDSRGKSNIHKRQMNMIVMADFLFGSCWCF